MLLMAGGTGSPKRVTVKVGGRELSLSNLDKQLYPAAGFRKADVRRWAAALAIPAMLWCSASQKRL